MSLYEVDDHVATIALNRPDCLNAATQTMKRDLRGAVEAAGNDEAVRAIIAAINGPCIDLGMVYAMYCDIRFASDTVVFSTSFSRLGMVAEHGTRWMLPSIVGHANALDLLLSSRRIDAAEALRMNFVSRVCACTALMTAARADARDLAENASPRATKLIKDQLYQASFQTLAEAVQSANHETALSFDSEDFKESIPRFTERRKARFTGR